MRLLRVVLRALFASARPQKPKIHLEPIPPARKIATRTVVATKVDEVIIVDLVEIMGRCWVIDGDTIDIRGTRIRLAGIDAPELEDPYGKVAKSTLMRLCKGEVIRAVNEGGQSYDRLVATCYLPDGRDLSAEMVKAGVAIDWPKFSRGKYRHLEPENVRKKLWRCDARQKGRVPFSLPD